MAALLSPMGMAARCLRRVPFSINPICKLITSTATSSDSVRSTMFRLPLRHGTTGSTGRCLYGTVEDFRSTLMEYPGGSVDLAKDDTTGIAKVKLNHPDRKNALSGQMMCDLADIVTDLECWSHGKGVLVYGADGSFCSGGDLNLMRGIGDPVQGSKMSAFMHHTVSRLQQLPLISVALIQGRALGGGAELTTACDFRLVTPNSSIGFVQARLGIVPGWGGGYRLVQIVGHITALELLSTCKIMTWKEALDYKLANGIIDDEQTAIEQAEKWLAVRVKAPIDTVRAVKKIVNNSWNPDMEMALEEERKIFASVWGGQAHREAMGKGIKHK